MAQSENKIAGLEEMLAHHEKTIEDLSTQLARQWTVIAELQSNVEVLTRRLVALEANSVSTPEITKPPHY